MSQRPIQEDALIESLRNIKGNRFLTITFKTEPKLIRPKSNPLYGVVVKVQSITGACGFNYSKAVNRQRTTEGKSTDFQSLPAWFEHVGGCLVRHKKTKALYIFLRPTSYGKPVFYVNNKETVRGDIAQHLYQAPKRDNGHQGTEKHVPFRTITVDKIMYVKGLKKEETAIVVK